MSRSGYSYDNDDNWALICWRGAVKSSIKGHRGQAMLRDLLVALDAMPEKKLISDELVADGSYCALGVLGAHRGIPMNTIDPYESRDVAKTFNISNALAKEIVFENDEGGWWDETPERRWSRMRQWVASKIVDDSAKPCAT